MATDETKPSDATSIAIPEIQGEQHRSAYEGQTVRTTGIVTGVDDVGIYVQDAKGDGNDGTSDAIAVYLADAEPPALGDEVTVEGIVAEYVPGGPDTGNLSITQIAGDVDVTVESEGNELPDAEVIGRDGRTPPTEVIEDDGFGSFDPEVDGIDFYESLESMRVTIADAQAVSGTNRFGEIYTVTDNGLGATGMSARGTINIAPDDFNPERVQIQENDVILPDFTIPEVDTGARLGDVTGVVGYSFGNFEVIPTEAFEVTRQSPLEPEVSTLESGDGSLTVASYNVLNLDPNDGDGDRDVSDDRYDALAAQITDNLNGPDIVALQEIQDDDGSIDPDNSDVTSADEGLQLLADAIAKAGGPSYEVIDNTFIGNGTSGGQPGGNIRTAFLYNDDRVDLVEGSVRTITDPKQQQADSRIGDGEGAFDPELNPFANARLPLVADFTVEGDDAPITVVNNHFSSKSGSDPLFGANQGGDGTQEEDRVDQIIERFEDASIDHTMVVAHRAGYFQDNAEIFTENSLSAIERSITDGVEMVELDVQKTKDGQFVILHDTSLDRTTDRTGEVADMTLAEVREANLRVVGTDEVTDEKVPTLEETFEAVDGEIMVNIDNKLGVENLAEIMTIARDMGVDEQIVIKAATNTDAEIAAAQATLDALPFDVEFMPILDDTKVDLATIEDVLDTFEPNAVEVFDTFDGEYSLDGGLFFTDEVKALFEEADARAWINTLHFPEDGRLSGGRGDDLALLDPKLVYGFYADAGASILQVDEVELAADYLDANGYRLPYEETDGGGAGDGPENAGVEQRNAQADAVRDFASGRLADDPDARIVVAGDFNEFEFLEPFERLQTDPDGERVLTNLTDIVPENERYTYNFEGNSQSLDHILASDALFEGAEVDIVQTNSEFAETPERASDHDPVLARFDLNTTGDDVLVA